MLTIWVVRCREFIKLEIDEDHLKEDHGVVDNKHEEYEQTNNVLALPVFLWTILQINLRGFPEIFLLSIL